MINVKELRIGNLVIDKEDGNPCVITCGKQIDSPYLMEPIPLTEIWLLRFGINKWMAGNTFEVRPNFDDSVSVYAWQNGICIFICHLQHVHQLQNLFYSLTGTELQLTKTV